MLNTIYANTTQFNQLLNAIQGGDTTAIVTALNDIKDSIDNISGGGSPIEIDSTQWQDLLNEIDKGDTTALATVLTTISRHLAQIKLNLDNVAIDGLQWGNLLQSFQGIINTHELAQWNDLINAIQSQQITFNLSNINTDNTQNNSLFNFTDLTSILNLIYNTLFNTDTSIIKWTKISTFSQFDVYCFKIGIIKFLFIDSAKNNISSGWQTGGVGTLPVGYGSLLNPYIQENKTLRNGIQMTIAVSSNGLLNVNLSANITTGTLIRCVHIYI